MTVPFMSYLNRAGLELEEAQDEDYLTSTAQAAKPWINLQAQLRSSPYQECNSHTEAHADHETLVALGAIYRQRQCLQWL